MKKIFVFILFLALVSLACGTTLAPSALSAPLSTSAPKAKPSALAESTPEAAQVCGTVNVRAQAGGGGSVVRVIEDKQITILERSGGWVRIGTGEWITDSVLCSAMGH